MAVWFQFRRTCWAQISTERERLYNNTLRKRKSFLCYAILRKAQQKRRLFHVNSLRERNSHAILNTLPTAIPMLITQKPVRKRLTDTKMRFFFLFSQLAKRSARVLPADLCTDHAHCVKNHRSTVLRRSKNMAVEGRTVSHYYIL